MYAQTIVYGLFAARCNHQGPEPFRRLGAAEEIPKTNPFLRRIFGTITSDEIDEEPYIDYVNDLVQILNNTDVESVLRYFGETGGQGDPVIHFYETFLSLYDPKVREERGVYYTPDPVVSYIVESVDHILKADFELEGGLHDSTMNEYVREKYYQDYEMKPENEQLPRTIEDECPRVLILDPACGTGTFLCGVINHIRRGFMDGMGAGYWPGYVKRYLLPRILGFELLMAPYAIAHFKLSMQLKGYDLPKELQSTWNYKFEKDRLGIYLTNTLSEPEYIWKTLYGPYRTITDEANEASVAKKDMPIMVIMGNPPYSGQSVNPSWEIINGKRRHTFIGNLLEDYYLVGNTPIHERQNKWLQDDYVKFVRWSQWRIERTGYGIIAFITNRNYIDNPTFRGMRWSLLNTFDHIYVLDLHGYYKGRSPNGSRDENIFNIQRGVAISIFIKKLPVKDTPTEIHYAEVWGTKEEKYHYLSKNNIGTTNWMRFIPKSPAYLFKPQDETIKSEYDNGVSIKDIFLNTGVGFVTARDKFVIAVDHVSLEERISYFGNLSIADQYFIDTYKLKDTTSWDLSKSRRLMAQSADWKKDIKKCLYRPFDLHSAC
jgi:predicted helicase